MISAVIFAKSSAEKLIGSRKIAAIFVLAIVLLGLVEYNLWSYMCAKMGLRHVRPRHCTVPVQITVGDDFKVYNGTRDIFIFSKLQPSSKNIFFLETSCAFRRKQPGRLILSQEQACSIYSAASSNPSYNVILLYTCPLASDFLLKSSTFVKRLLDLPSFYLAEANFENLLADKTFDELNLDSDNITQLNPGILRFLVIYMYGGTFIDMNTVNIKSLDVPGVNFVVATSSESIGNSIFNFEPEHWFLKEYLLYAIYARESYTEDLLFLALKQHCNISEHIQFDWFQIVPGCDLTVLFPYFFDEQPIKKGHSPNNSSNLNVTTARSSHRNVSTWDLERNLTEGIISLEQFCKAISHGDYEKVISSDSVRDHGNPVSEVKFFSRINQAKDTFIFRKLAPSSGNIFFLETSCPFNETDPGGLSLSSRQACAIYSTAHYNPTRNVILLHTCPLASDFIKQSPASVRTLFDLPNFSVAELNLTEFYNGTSIAEMISGLKKSTYPIVHNSDILRLLVVYMYGGTYMDLDIISMKSLDELGTNFIGAESTVTVANGIFNFEKNHDFLLECLKRIFSSYDPEIFTTIGPKLVVSVLRSYCKIMDPQPFEKIGYVKSCNVTVLSSDKFYAIPWKEWKMFYYEKDWPAVKSKLKNSFVAHVWNHMGSRPVIVRGNQPYARIANQHCKPVLALAGHLFQGKKTMRPPVPRTMN